MAVSVIWRASIVMCVQDLNRTEEMSREVMDACITFAKEQNSATIDITGGAPEMNPDLEYLVRRSSKICNHVIVRTNLVSFIGSENMNI